MTPQQINNELANEVKDLLNEWGDLYPVEVINDGKTVIVTVPATVDLFHTAGVRQGLCTERLRAQKRDRQLRVIEVKYRNGVK